MRIMRINRILCCYYFCKLTLDLKRVNNRALVCFPSSWWWLLSLTKSLWLTLSFSLFFFQISKQPSRKLVDLKFICVTLGGRFPWWMSLLFMYMLNQSICSYLEFRNVLFWDVQRCKYVIWNSGWEYRFINRIKILANVKNTEDTLSKFQWISIYKL
jgi:hypothetical protein